MTSEKEFFDLQFGRLLAAAEFSQWSSDRVTTGHWTAERAEGYLRNESRIIGNYLRVLCPGFE